MMLLCTVVLAVSVIFLCFMWFSICLFRYNIEQEQKLALETTVLVEQYTVSEQEVNEKSALLDGSVKIIQLRH